MRKKVLGFVPAPQGHWVGDGFPVRSLFSYTGLGQHLSPFLLLDYAGPAQFEPASRPRGVGEHPHRGFETVTIVYAGEVAHRDSTGNGGLIGPGDVQWMTAASGILHEEFHSPDFTRRGGTLEMAQLWVNLPAKDKRAEPRYQTILNAQIPEVLQPDGGTTVRVIAGRFGTHSGPALTFTDLNVWDVRMAAGGRVSLPVQSGHTAAIALFRGAVAVNDSPAVSQPGVVVLDRVGEEIVVQAGTAGATFLLLSGEPIAEPIVGYGPFVMNSRAEIETAMNDFNAGKFGRMPAAPVAMDAGARADA
jgi:redox-sensitive bicupin YhaK (pirin superfamily)